MDKQYYYSQGGQQIGPMSLNDLYNQRVTPETLFWYQGLPNWQKGYELPELAPLFNRMPPPISSAGPPSYTPPPIYSNPPLQPTPHAYEWYLGVWQKYAQFTGRARRSEYWYFVLFNCIALVAVLFIDAALGTSSRQGGTGAFYVIYNLAVLLPSLSVGVRRMHDVGKSGWFLLIPFYNLVLACTEGNRGPNQYGADPKYIL